MALAFQESAAFEHRPMMLKDFLIRDDDCFHNLSSSSSSSKGFSTMYPRTKKPCKSSTVAVSSNKSDNKPHILLLRSWSRKAAAATRTAAAIHNVVKFFHFTSRKISKRSGDDKNGAVLGEHVSSSSSEVKVVKVKDILRWRSFRDVVEVEEEDNSLPSSPRRSTTTAAAATTTTTTSCSKRSSWCDSDFTAEELQLWCGGENGESLGKKCFTDTNAKLRSPKARDFSFEEYEQKSPVSVLDSPFQEVEEYKELLIKSQDNNNDHVMLFDFFMHEISNLDHDNGINYVRNNVKFDYEEVLRVAKSWVNGECDESYDWDSVEDKRESYVKDMEKGLCWKRFTQEQEIVSNGLEVAVWDELLHELLLDFSH